MKPICTLVMLASEGGYRLLSSTALESGLTEVETRLADDFPDVAVSFDDRPGRGETRPGGAHHGYDARATAQEKARHRMAHHIMAALQQTWDKGGYDRFILSAPDKMLAVLRHDMPAALAPHQLADMDKDLVKIPIHDLPSHFSDLARV